MTETVNTLISRSIIEVLAQHASDRAEAVAVEDARQQLTYRELDERSAGIARAVRDTVAGRSQAVALLIDHGVQQYAAVAGVLKSGHICLPLEPTQPERRLVQIVDHARPAVIVTDDANRTVAERFSGGELPVISLSAMPTRDGSSIDADLNLYDPALILYTSGSTGRPKGVLHTHENVLQSALLHAESVLLRGDDRVSMLYSYTSSAGLKVDVVSALVTGATVCLYDLRAQGMRGVGAWLRGNRITVYHSVPEVFREFCLLLDKGATFPSVRWVQLGGAQVRWSDYDTFREHFGPECQFVNGLGATETGRVSIHLVSDDRARHSLNLPVGRPVEDVTVRLIDDDGTDVTASGAGEMIVSSPNLASGYWREPELTALAFRRDAAGVLWYHTGDLATRTPDGMFELLGRTDFVVNVNGNRVDVGEVEQALRLLDGIKDAAVVAEDTSGSVELTAFLVGEGDRDFHGVRQELAAMLPTYMIPPKLLDVDALPRTPSGKLDRVALASGAGRAQPASSLRSAPQSELAAVVASIWCEVLGVEEVGEEDDFLDLGGTSLRGMRVLAELEKRVGVTLPVKRLFEAENFRAFVDVVAGAGSV